MRARDGTWDIRCPKRLGDLFPRRSGYYFRVDRKAANEVLDILSEAYGIPAPQIGMVPKGGGQNGLYDYETQTVLLYPRNHLRTVFHEFYHHLDNLTDGGFDSDDREGGSSSLAWMFADRLWANFSGRRYVGEKRDMKMQSDLKEKEPLAEELEPGKTREQTPGPIPITAAPKGKKRHPKRGGCGGGSLAGNVGTTLHPSGGAGAGNLAGASETKPRPRPTRKGTSKKRKHVPR